MIDGPTVFVVDDDEAVRQSLRWLIESTRVHVQTFASAREFLAAYDLSSPGCLVLDIRLPGMSGIELQNHLHEQGVTLPVIIITGHADVPTAVRALKGGAVEFIEKPVNDQVLLDRIAHALQLDQQNRAEQSQTRWVRQRLASLTQRERQVLELVVAGGANKEVAAKLGVTQKTVEVHRARAMRKMGARNLADLVRTVTQADPANGRKPLP